MLILVQRLGSALDAVLQAHLNAEGGNWRRVVVISCAVHAFVGHSSGAQRRDLDPRYLRWARRDLEQFRQCSRHIPRAAKVSSDRTVPARVEASCRMPIKIVKHSSSTSRVTVKRQLACSSMISNVVMVRSIIVLSSGLSALIEEIDRAACGQLQLSNSGKSIAQQEQQSRTPSHRRLPHYESEPGIERRFGPWCRNTDSKIIGSHERRG